MNRALSFILLVLLSWACVDEINDDYIHIKPQIVVNSYFCQNEPIKVFLSKSYSPFFDGQIETVKTAKVTLYEDDLFLDNLTFQTFYYEKKEVLDIRGSDTSFFHIRFPIDSCFSNTEIYPRLGRRYRIEVEVDDFKKVSAESTVPDLVSIEKVSKKLRYTSWYGRPLEKGIPYFEVLFNDPPESNNYLISFLNVNDFPSYKYDYRIRIPFSSDDPVIGHFESAYNTYNPLFMTFGDQLFNGYSYPLTVMVDERNLFQSIELSSRDSIEVSIMLNNLSPEFNQFLKSLQASSDQNNNPLAEPVSVFSNVENGLGVFAGYACSKESIKLFNNQ